MSQTRNHLFDLCIRIADNNLILGQQICLWCGHGPYLEEDIALSNIGLDMLGQGRYFYQYASELENQGRTEDELAFLRVEKDYLNDLIVELPNGDYAFTIARIYIVALFQKLLLNELKICSDDRLNGLAEKALKENTYHIRHTESWLLRFGKGTEVSAEKVNTAFKTLYAYTSDLFEQTPNQEVALGEKKIEPLKSLKDDFYKMLNKMLSNAAIAIPETQNYLQGRLMNIHTEHMGFLLAELQYLQRTYPNCNW